MIPLLCSVAVSGSETPSPTTETAPITKASPARSQRTLNLPEISKEDVAKVVRSGPMLALSDAVPQALRKNLGIAVSRVEKSIVEDSPEIAESAFDPLLSFSSTYASTGSSGYWKSPSFSQTSQQSWANTLSLAKQFAYGTEARIYGNFNRGYNLNSLTSSTNYVVDAAVSAGVSVTQPLLKGFGKTVNLAPLVTARQNVLRSGLSLRKETLDLIYDTEVAYWNLSASYALVSARLSSLRYAESVLEEAKKKRALDNATLEDVLQAEADLASRKVNLVHARQSVEDCDDALRKLLGEKGDEDEARVYQVASLSETGIDAETRSFGEWIRAVRSFDIDLQIKEIESDLAELNREVAENADKPSLDVVVGAELGSRERSPYDAFRGIVSENRRGYELSAGIVFSMPIGFRQSEAELRQAIKRQRNVENETAQVLQNAMFNARSAWRALEAARERFAAAELAMKMQKESFEGQCARYRLGAATMTDVLSAQNSLDSARLEAIQARLDLAVARAKTARLDGRILSENGFSWKEIDEFQDSEN